MEVRDSSRTVAGMVRAELEDALVYPRKAWGRSWQNLILNLLLEAAKTDCRWEASATFLFQNGHDEKPSSDQEEGIDLVGLLSGLVHLRGDCGGSPDGADVEIAHFVLHPENRGAEAEAYDAGQEPGRGFPFDESKGE